MLRIRSKRSKRSKQTKKQVRTQRRKRVRTQRRKKGGDYTTATTAELDNMPYIPNAVIAFPGGGVMSIAAYKRLMEDRDRNGKDY